MSHDYTYREMKQMQEDAVRRVWEMQKRATLPPESETQKTVEPESSKEGYDEPKKRKTKSETKSNKPAPHPGKRRNQNDFMNKIPDRINHLLRDDELCEQILLIAILILLMNENSDNILILAILYILAD